MRSGHRLLAGPGHPQRCPRCECGHRARGGIEAVNFFIDIPQQPLQVCAACSPVVLLPDIFRPDVLRPGTIPPAVICPGKAGRLQIDDVIVHDAQSCGDTGGRSRAGGQLRFRKQGAAATDAGCRRLLVDALAVGANAQMQRRTATAAVIRLRSVFGGAEWAVHEDEPVVRIIDAPPRAASKRQRRRWCRVRFRKDGGLSRRRK